MVSVAHLAQLVLGCILILSSLGVIMAKKPVHASLFFLLTLLALAALYLQLSAQFIAVMQMLVYAGAILVIFMFVVILFQDAYLQIAKYKAKSSPFLLWFALGLFLLSLLFLGVQLLEIPPSTHPLPLHFGEAQSLGQILYIDFFFPFEAIVLLFLVAIVGALYIAKKAG
jgi:NADH-quinone oxidoreductase subunit J